MIFCVSNRVQLNLADTGTLNPFEDVAEGKYYYEPVLWAYYHNPQITGGTDENHFSPKKDCTREQIVTFLWKASGSPEPKTSNNPFNDVKSGKYYFKAVMWAVENNITGGVSANQFGVGKTCTRAQIVTFLYEADKLLHVVKDLSVNSYGRLTITVVNGSGNLTYRFQKLNQISGAWETVVTKTSSSRTITLDSSMGGTFRCVITDAKGYTITSGTARAAYG